MERGICHLVASPRASHLKSKVDFLSMRCIHASTYTMSVAELDERPAKKRRFFVEDSPRVQHPLSPPAVKLKETDDATTADEVVKKEEEEEAVSGFDVQLLESIVGEKIPPDVQETLQRLSEGNVERGLLT